MTATAIYQIEHLAGLPTEHDDIDVSCFNPTVNFVAENQPPFPLTRTTWHDLGKPRTIKITVEAA